jgi:hypothetical protein
MTRNLLLLLFRLLEGNRELLQFLYCIYVVPGWVQCQTRVDIVAICVKGEDYSDWLSICHLLKKFSGSQEFVTLFT